MASSFSEIRENGGWFASDGVFSGSPASGGIPVADIPVAGRSRGMPSTRSLMTLRAISVVPPPIWPALANEEGHAPPARSSSDSSQATPAAPAISNATVLSRWR